MLSKLEPVGVEQVPRLGTFWLLKEGEPPWPFLPPMATEFGLQVYAIDSGTFVVDDRGVDYEALDRVDSALKVIEKKLGLRAGAGANQSLTGDGVKALGGASIAGLSYPSSNVWFELVSFTNQTGRFVIHSPTNGAFDLFYTTNLTTNVQGLNLTNWAFLCRFGSNQTDVVVSNLICSQCYFILGIMNDYDHDGLTEAYEQLVSHTLWQTNDTDGDGLKDAWELANGMNPLLNESQLDAYKRTYTYDKGGWLRQVSVPAQGFSLDNEGNVLCAW